MPEGGRIGGLQLRRRHRYHTYSTLGRGFDQFVNANDYLDLTALGRQEEWEEPRGRPIPLGLNVGGPALCLHDEYQDARA